MSLRNTLLSAALVLGLHGACIAAHEHAPQAGSSSLEPATAKYVLDLTLEEFSVLHSAAADGVKTYGGHADFKVDIFQTARGPAWQVTITDPRLLPVWSQWMAEKTTQLVALTDIDQLDEPTKLAYRVSRSVNLKLKEAAGKPVLDSIRVSGVVRTGPGGEARLEVAGQPGTLKVTGAAARVLASLPGREAVVEGVIKTAGELEASAAFEKKDDTLEVFVISQCPFGKAAETAIINRLRSMGSSAAGPRVEFRYLFIPFAPDAGARAGTFTCLHGDAEADENVVQMILRDQFPDRFFDYLLKRSTSEAPWKEVVKSVGLDEFGVEAIERAMLDKGELIAAEYAYAQARNVPPVSPTYLWEGRVLKDLEQLPQFKGIKLQAGSCGG